MEFPKPERVEGAKLGEFLGCSEALRLRGVVHGESCGRGVVEVGSHCGQVDKGAWWMFGRQEPMKDVAKLR